MPEETRRTLEAYLAQLRKRIHSQLQAVILYGSLARGDYLVGRSNINLLVLLSDMPLDLLQWYGRFHRPWSKERIVTPLFMIEDELQRSLNVFPLEYLEIKEQHVLLEGRDPFPALHIDLQHLLIQCEQEIQGNLLRVRQRFVEGLGRPEAIQVLLPISLTALIPCMRGIFRLLGHSPIGTVEAVLDRLNVHLGLEAAAFQEVLSMKRGLVSPGSLELPRVFERYVTALQGLIARVQDLKAEGRL